MKTLKLLGMIILALTSITATLIVAAYTIGKFAILLMDKFGALPGLVIFLFVAVFVFALASGK